MADERYRGTSAAAESIGPQVADRIANGDLDGAISEYERAVRQAPDDLRLVSDFGFFLWQLYEFRRAKELFERLVVDERTSLATLRAMSKCHFDIGQFAAAAKVMEVAIARSNTPTADELVMRAGALERSNQIELATDLTQRALSLEPTNRRAIRMLAHIERRQGDVDRAVARLEHHLGGEPNEWDWGLRYELATCYDKLGRYDDAWNKVTQAKRQLDSQTEKALGQSHTIRQRQWDIARKVTDSDLRRWRSVRDTVPPSRVTLLAGFPRSGTTLLEQMISVHPDCVGTDETGIVTTQFTAPLLWYAPTPSDAVVELRSFLPDEISNGQAVYFRMTQEFIGQMIGGRRLIEKDPLLIPDLPMLLRLFPDLSIIMPLRDPRDVLISYYFTMVPLNWNSAPSTTLGEAARFYADCMRHWLLFRNRLDAPVLETRYEDLTADPSSTLRHVARFLDLPWTDKMLDDTARSDQKAIRTPTYDDITKPISQRAVGRWHNYEQHIRAITPIIEPFLKAFGYQT